MRRTFGPENPYQCPLCGESLATAYDLTPHMRWRHPGMKHCPKCFAMMPADDLPPHLESHRAERVPCPHCGRLMSKRALGGHISSAHGENWMKNPENHRRAMEQRGQNAGYRQHLSDRMKAKNPMMSDSARAQMADSIKDRIAKGDLKAYGGRPYGNGAAPTPAETHLMAAYPNAAYQHVVVLGDGEKPFHYKLDLAWPDKKIGLDVDGTSHQKPSRKAADARKRERLTHIGWVLLRLPNPDALCGKAESLLSAYGITAD